MKDSKDLECTFGSKLGSGSNGTVRKGTIENTNRTAAIKNIDVKPGDSTYYVELEALFWHTARVHASYFSLCVHLKHLTA